MYKLLTHSYNEKFDEYQPDLRVGIQKRVFHSRSFTNGKTVIRKIQRIQLHPNLNDLSTAKELLTRKKRGLYNEL